MRFPNSRASFAGAVPLRIRLAAAAVLCCLACAGAAGARELFSLRIENEEGGRIQVRLRDSREWSTVGNVTQPATRTVAAFPAAAFVPPSTVAATAVHGLRIRVPSSRPDPVSISIQPAEFRTLPDRYGGHIPGRSAIFTDIPAGRAIFRDFAPLAGDAVLIEAGARLAGLPVDWQPAPGEVILIECTEADSLPRSIEFENRRGGAITVTAPDGTAQQIGTVRQPVTGVGRFDGTSYTGTGAINTNHGGVITVSTAPESRPADEGAPPESRGGFEIQPYQHAKTQPDMTQAMVVAPVDSARTFEGAPPLFSGVLPLGDGSSVVDLRAGARDWTPLPAITGKISDAFTAAGLARLGLAPAGTDGVTAIRIRPQPRDAARLKAALAKIALPELPGTPGGAPMKAAWALRMPYPDEAAHAVFSRDGRTIAISNVRPFEVRADITERLTTLRADIVAADGRTLETRTATVTVKGGTISIAEKSSSGR